VTVRFVADENFNRRIVTGLLRRIEDLDLVRVQDVGLAGGDDPTVLGWAAEHGRVLLTHDAATIPDCALARLAAPPPRW
jgi:predicted nuclease of predicted toxin-antitoxin system